MLVLRENQIRTLQQAALENFKTCAHTDLSERYQAKLQAHHAGYLSDLIEYGIAKCDAYGITHQDDVIEVLERMIAQGLDFEHAPRNGYVLAIFRDSHIPGDQKVYEVTKREVAAALSKTPGRSG